MANQEQLTLLKQGINRWNQWRQEQPSIEVDLLHDDVICEYFYFHQNQQERRPRSGNFRLGEFTALFQRAFDTVDLIFIDGIDWQAFLQAFQELRLLYNDKSISVQAIEKKKDSAFIIRLEVPLDCDKTAIERQLKESYDKELKARGLMYQKQFRIQYEDVEFERQRNAELMKVISTMAENTGPDININQVGNLNTGTVNIHGNQIGEQKP